VKVIHSAFVFPCKFGSRPWKHEAGGRLRVEGCLESRSPGGMLMATGRSGVVPAGRIRKEIFHGWSRKSLISI